jgi:hypothetical protein
MTVLSETSRADSVGDGVTDEFPFAFEIYTKTDILVYVSGVLQTVDVQYTVPVVGINNPAGGNVLFGGAYIPALDAPVAIILDLPLTQATDYTEGDKFPAETHETALDRVVKLLQQLKEELSRQPALAESSLYSGLTLPDPEASKYLVWKDDLSGLKNVDIVSSGDLAVTAFIQTLLDDADAGEALTTLGVTAFIKTLLDDADAGEALTTLGVDDLLDYSSRLLEPHDTDHTVLVFNKAEKRRPITIGDTPFMVSTAINISSVTDLDTGVIEAGKDYCTYACNDAGSLTFLNSLASTWPAGYDADTSRKVGGYHTLCVAAGTIPGHSLSGYAQKDIIPSTVWDLKHRASNGVQVGQLWNPSNNRWEDIYMASDDGAGGSQSVFGAAILDTIDWMDMVDRGGKTGKKLFLDDEFQIAAAGSPEETNIAGSADPGTTGGHVDTAGVRILSDLGHEDMTGVLWHWLRDQSYRYDGEAWTEYDLPGGKGSLKRQGTYGDVKLAAGGYWDSAAYAGSRARSAINFRWFANADIGARFGVEPM